MMFISQNLLMMLLTKVQGEGSRKMQWFILTTRVQRVRLFCERPDHNTTFGTGSVSMVWLTLCGYMKGKGGKKTHTTNLLLTLQNTSWSVYIISPQFTDASSVYSSWNLITSGYLLFCSSFKTVVPSKHKQRLLRRWHWRLLPHLTRICDYF